MDSLAVVLKRRRLDNLDVGPAVIKQSPEVWFDDGNVVPVIVAGGVGLVSRSVLPCLHLTVSCYTTVK